jgi:hypothetical protein
MALSSAPFVRRFNLNGTMDSICNHCFLTVATAASETDLDSAERCHECDPWRLESLRASVERPEEYERWRQ